MFLSTLSKPTHNMISDHHFKRRHYFEIISIILYMQNVEEKAVVQTSGFVAAPLLLLFIIVSVRMALYSLSATAVFGNPVISLFFNEGHISLNDFMRMII